MKIDPYFKWGYTEAMNRSAHWYFGLGQVLFYGGLLICVILLPGGAGDDAGISFYGVHRLTIVPYLIALIGSSACGFYAARRIGTGGRDYRLRYGLMLFALLAIGVALTPYDLSDWIYTLHTGFGSVLFALQLTLTGWICFWYAKSWRTITLWAVELAAGLASAYFIVMPTGHLFLSQLAFQMCFSGILLITLPRGEVAGESA